MMEDTQSNQESNSFVAFNIPDEQPNAQNDSIQNDGLQFISTNFELNSEPATPSPTSYTSVKFAQDNGIFIN